METLEKEKREAVLKRQQLEDTFIQEKTEMQRKMTEMSIKLDDAEHNVELVVAEKLKLNEVEKMKNTRQLEQLKQTVSEQTDLIEQLKKQKEAEKEKIGMSNYIDLILG